MIRVSGLFCFPLKSARGFAVDRLDVDPGGPRHDRQWVVVDETGTFVAQRSSRGRGLGIRELCLVDTELHDGDLCLRGPGMPELRVPIEGAEGSSVDVSIWRDIAPGVDQGAEAAAWFTEFLGRYKPGSYRLIRMPDIRTRRAPAGDAPVGYADAYPLLIGSDSSLADLNRRIAERRAAAGEEPAPVLGWDRFRPNVVLSGDAPYAEDDYGGLRIGDVLLRGHTLCVRCPIPATDQATGRLGKEPLRTLAGYRRRPDADAGGGVVFARNFTHTSAGAIAIGDPATVT